MSHGDGRGDVVSVVATFEPVFQAVGQRARIAFDGHRGAFGGHRRERRVLLGDEGRAAVRGEVVEQLALAAADPLGASEPFEVGASHVGQQAVVGFGDGGQQGDFAAGARAHLHDAELRAGIHRQQRQRDADVVVEVAAGGIDLETAREDAAHEFLGGGFSVAARYGEDRDTQCAAVFARESLEGLQRVGYETYAGIAAGRRGIVRHGEGRSAGEGFGDEAVAVERGAAQAKKTESGTIRRVSVETTGCSREKFVEFGHGVLEWRAVRRRTARRGQMCLSPLWNFTSSMNFLMFCSSARGQISSTSSVSTTIYSFRPLMTAIFSAGSETIDERVS